MQTEHVVIMRRVPPLPLSTSVAAIATYDAARGRWGGCVHSYCAGRRRVTLKRLGHSKYCGVTHAVSQAICVVTNKNQGGMLSKWWIWETWWGEWIDESKSKCWEACQRWQLCFVEWRGTFRYLCTLFFCEPGLSVPKWMRGPANLGDKN